MTTNDVTNQIMYERIEFGVQTIKEIIQKNKMSLSDFEIMDLAVRVANAIFIEKGKQYRFPKKQ